MGSKETVVRVKFIHNNKFEVLQECSPRAFLWQDGNMQHIGIRENDATFVTNLIPLAHRRISIESFHNDVF